MGLGGGNGGAAGIALLFDLVAGPISCGLIVLGDLTNAELGREVVSVGSTCDTGIRGMKLLDEISC